MEFREKPKKRMTNIEVKTDEFVVNERDKVIADWIIKQTRPCGDCIHNTKHHNKSCDKCDERHSQFVSLNPIKR